MYSSSRSSFLKVAYSSEASEDTESVESLDNNDDCVRLLCGGSVLAGFSTATSPMTTIKVIEFPVGATQVLGSDKKSNRIKLMEITVFREGRQ